MNEPELTNQYLGALATLPRALGEHILAKLNNGELNEETMDAIIIKISIRSILVAAKKEVLNLGLQDEIEKFVNNRKNIQGLKLSIVANVINPYMQITGEDISRATLDQYYYHRAQILGLEESIVKLVNFPSNFNSVDDSIEN